MRCLLLWRRRRFTIFMMVEKAFQGRTVIDVKLYLRSMVLSELLMFYRFWSLKDLWVEVPFYPLALLWLFASFASETDSSPKLLKPYSFSFWQMEIINLHPNTLLTCKKVSIWWGWLWCHCLGSVWNQISPSVNAMQMIILIYGQEAVHKRLFAGEYNVDDARL